MEDAEVLHGELDDRDGYYVEQLKYVERLKPFL